MFYEKMVTSSCKYGGNVYSNLGYMRLYNLSRDRVWIFIWLVKNVKQLQSIKLIYVMVYAINIEY